MSILNTLKNGFPIYLNPLGTLQAKNKKSKQKSSIPVVLLRKRKYKNTELLNQIQKDFKLTKTDAKKAFQAYCLIIEKNLNKHSIVTIPQVGIISINEKGKYVLKSFVSGNFEKKKKKKSRKKKSNKKSNRIVALAPSTKSIPSDNSALPKPSDEIIEVDSLSDTEQKDKEKIDQKLHKEINELETIEHNSPDQDDLKEVLKDHFYQEDQEDIFLENTDTQEVESSSNYKATALPYFSSESPFRPWIIGILSTIVIIALVYLVYKSLDRRSSVIKDSSDALELVVPEKEQKGLDLSESTEEILAVDYTEKCIIITGTFSQIYNEEHMRNQIISHGYSPYTEQINDMTRVGIEIDCSKENMDEILKIVRDDIAPEAWYLYPPD